MLSLVITPALDGREVRAVLKGELLLSGTQIKRARLAEGGITLNGIKVHTNARVKTGDLLAFAISEPSSVTDHPGIVYRDEHLVIFDKPAGMCVHPAPMCAGELTVKDIIAPTTVFHPVNRLDRGTTGLMVVALSGYCHDRLKAMLHTGAFLREYLAVVEGIAPDSGIIDLPIYCAGGIKRSIDERGKPSLTRFETVKRSLSRSLLRVFPETGRTHQIRLHLSQAGLPLTGDWLYGAEDKELIARPALHSSRIVVTHPVTGRLIDISSPLPADMAYCLKISE